MLALYVDGYDTGFYIGISPEDEEIQKVIDIILQTLQDTYYFEPMRILTELLVNIARGIVGYTPVVDILVGQERVGPSVVIVYPGEQEYKVEYWLTEITNVRYTFSSSSFDTVLRLKATYHVDSWRKTFVPICN